MARLCLAVAVIVTLPVVGQRTAPLEVLLGNMAWRRLDPVQSFQLLTHIAEEALSLTLD